MGAADLALGTARTALIRGVSGNIFQMASFGKHLAYFGLVVSSD